MMRPPDARPIRLSVVILQHGGSEMTRRAVSTFRAACGAAHEILVVDNASPSAADREAAARIEGSGSLLLPENLGFGAGNNRGAARTSGEVLLFLNNDTTTGEDFVAPVLEAFAAGPEVGIVGPRIDNPDGTPQLSHGRLPSFTREAVDRAVHSWVGSRNRAGRGIAARHVRRRRAVEWVTGAALFIRRDLFERLGGFDERFFLYFEDKDLCARCRQAGMSVLFLPAPGVAHARGGSAGPEMRDRLRTIYRESQRRYYAKHRPARERGLLRLYQSLAP